MLAWRSKKGGRKFCQYGVLYIVKRRGAKFSNGAGSHVSLTRPSFAGKRKPQVVWSARGEVGFSHEAKFRVLWETKAARKVLVSCGGLAGERRYQVNQSAALTNRSTFPAMNTPAPTVAR